MPREIAHAHAAKRPNEHAQHEDGAVAEGAPDIAIGELVLGLGMALSRHAHKLGWRSCGCCCATRGAVNAADVALDLGKKEQRRVQRAAVSACGPIDNIEEQLARPSGARRQIATGA
eukprot:2406838-Prymnesium_polylepis.2